MHGHDGGVFGDGEVLIIGALQGPRWVVTLAEWALGVGGRAFAGGVGVGACGADWTVGAAGVFVPSLKTARALDWGWSGGVRAFALVVAAEEGYSLAEEGVDCDCIRGGDSDKSCELICFHGFDAPDLAEVQVEPLELGADVVFVGSEVNGADYYGEDCGFSFGGGAGHSRLVERN